MKKYSAHFALVIVNLIYGINFTVVKDVMPTFIKPNGFILTRVFFALVLFLFTSAVLKFQKIKKSDFPRLILCGIFGVACNQILFFQGLNITTPINASIIMTSSPIIVFIISVIIARERMWIVNISGIIVGTFGAIILILYSHSDNIGDSQLLQSPALGDFLVFLNAVSYGCYLILVKPLMKRYKPITVITWVFFFGFCFVLPFGISNFINVEWFTLPLNVYLKIGFVIVFTTFIAYLMNVFSLKKLSSTVVSSYIYLQPFFTAIVALSVGKDSLTKAKIIASIFVFSGIYMVNKKQKPKKI